MGGPLSQAKPSAGNRVPNNADVIVEVTKTEAKISKSQKPMIETEFTVRGGEHDEKSWREWLGTHDTGTWGHRTATILRAAGLAHMIDGEVQAPDHVLAQALLGKHLRAKVKLETEKNEDGSDKTYIGNDGNVYPSTRNQGISWSPANAAPVQAQQQAPVQQQVQQAPVQQQAPQYAPPQGAPQYAPPQVAQQPAPQYAQPQQQQAPQYVQGPPQGQPQYAAPQGGQPAAPQMPWQVPAPAAAPAKGSRKTKQA